MRMWEILEESFDQPLVYKWEQQSRDNWLGHFDVDGTRYAIYISSDPHFTDPVTGEEQLWYSLSFGLEDNVFAGVEKPLGTDAAFRIFSTALSGFREFIENVTPERFIIAAMKADNNRFRLYTRLGQRFGNSLAALGYHPCEAPNHSMADIKRGANILAWKRS